MAENDLKKQEKENKKIEKQREKEIKKREKQEEKEFKNRVKESSKQSGKNKKKGKKGKDTYTKYSLFTRILAFLLCFAMVFSVFVTLISYLIAD